MSSNFSRVGATNYSVALNLRSFPSGLRRHDQLLLFKLRQKPLHALFIRRNALEISSRERPDRAAAKSQSPIRRRCISAAIEIHDHDFGLENLMDDLGRIDAEHGEREGTQAVKLVNARNFSAECRQ